MVTGLRVSQKKIQSSLVWNIIITDSGTPGQTESSMEAAHCLKKPQYFLLWANNLIQLFPSCIQRTMAAKVQLVTNWAIGNPDRKTNKGRKAKQIFLAIYRTNEEKCMVIFDVLFAHRASVCLGGGDKLYIPTSLIFMSWSKQLMCTARN